MTAVVVVGVSWKEDLLLLQDKKKQGCFLHELYFQLFKIKILV